MLHIYLQKERKKKHDATTLAQFDKKKIIYKRRRVIWKSINIQQKNKKNREKKYHIFK